MREGFTFVELLLVLVLGTMLLGAVYETLSRQEEAYGLFNAVAGTQQDTRMGMDVLAAELREVSAGGGDLIMATQDSLKIRGLRQFGLICATDKNNKRFTVANLGAGGFVVGDSVLIYVDQDSLKAADDTWQRDVLSAVGTTTCTTTLGLSLGSLLPGGTLQQLTVPGAGLRFDSIFPGAPIRSFETVTYRVGTTDGEPFLQRVVSGTATPLFGPVPATGGFRIEYFDTAGTQLTTFPLSAADRAIVQRIRLELHARRRAGGPGSTYTDSLVSDIYLRGG
ncbi:MAG: prepilin-type N-terminal cleavage/methylation domain-containing protein [Gemmatimonadetes bacterium]|nr:prepilin-type N-terminal cleavage/methylation domain-containing protein [Gemmatimonadota bacterium]